MSLAFLLLSFLAGILTVLAPCVLPLLPVILAGAGGSKSWFRPIIIIISLAISLILFTVAVKITTLAFSIDQSIWRYISGGIIIIFGLFYIFPEVWEAISLKLELSKNSDELLEKVSKKETFWSPALIGFTLGPVFSSCSPTYGILVAVILPTDFFIGLVYLLAYVLGLSLVMLLIGLSGYRITKKLRWGSDPKGLFRKVLGLVFILTGMAIVTNLDKTFEIWLIEQGISGNISIETWLRERLE